MISASAVEINCMPGRLKPTLVSVCLSIVKPPAIMATSAMLTSAHPALTSSIVPVMAAVPVRFGSAGILAE